MHEDVRRLSEHGSEDLFLVQDLVLHRTQLRKY